MAYTQTDLANVTAAITALATGSRVARVTIGDKSINYSDAELSDLRKLRGEIRAELMTASKRRGARVLLLRTSKGL